ncbi:conserved hypothetical protein [Perkinsus marinus ATCC 50983]|uniref:Methyltransferase domain-containing protein n=1 Tax=Perkinsus marinus (strain ATCC 50983 / TXsc) TaxID=423536 RepID=C5LF73_PERM5|nr:conserved hypothetical protein [Perkinsus marinus ATCC 50983]EER04588.1 conserved hypothetical protein [Perkinsus marinus ATCC 50983]|eukprot:XP_002772772.1 conserved hypothetical protein [Perkinsus marinus ATCC 50983]
MTVTPSTTEAGKKRPAEEIAQEAEEEEEDLRRYGDASYWEGRYKAKKQRLDEEGDKTDKKAATEGDDDDDDADSTDEWHFSFEAMRELLPEKKDITVVDVGCGVSSFLNSMREAGYTGRLIGLDYSPSAIDMCKEMFKEVEYHNKEAAEMCPAIVKPGEVDMFLDKATIDGLLADESGAEHVQKLCKAEGQAMKVGGQLIWSTMFGPFEESGVKVLKETILPGLLAGDEKASFKIYCYALDDGTEEIELPGLEGEDDGEGKEESAEHAEPGHVEEPKAAEGATVASGEKEEVEVEEGDEIDMAELGDINEMIMQALAENETLAIWAIEKIEKPTDAPKDTAQLIDKIIEDIEVNVQGGDDDEKEEAEEEEKE